ncbi:MAG: hypothetical protein ACQERL_01170 [Bacillota bacterium]
MWQVVYVASSKEEVDDISKFMEKEGFMLQIDDAGSGSYQIRVPAIEAEEAYSCLHKNF